MHQGLLQLPALFTPQQQLLGRSRHCVQPACTLTLLPCRCSVFAADMRRLRRRQRRLAVIQLQRRGNGEQHDGGQYHVTHQGCVLPAPTNMRLHVCQQPNPGHADLPERLRDQYEHVLGQPSQCQHLLHGG